MKGGGLEREVELPARAGPARFGSIPAPRPLLMFEQLAGQARIGAATQRGCTSERSRGGEHACHGDMMVNHRYEPVNQISLRPRGLFRSCPSAPHGRERPRSSQPRGTSSPIPIGGRSRRHTPSSVPDGLCRWRACMPDAVPGQATSTGRDRRPCHRRGVRPSEQRCVGHTTPRGWRRHYRSWPACRAKRRPQIG